ncbi:GGDEF domain-containing protein [Sessilibacter sp. MAH4]
MTSLQGSSNVDLLVSHLHHKFQEMLSVFDGDPRDYFVLLDSASVCLSGNKLFTDLLIRCNLPRNNVGIHLLIEELDYEDHLLPAIDQCLDGATVKSNQSITVKEARNKFFDYSCYPIRIAGGEVAGVFLILHDVSRSKVAERKLRQLAHLDPLTQLLNLRFIDFQLRKIQAQSARDGTGFSVVFIDFDRFKKVNDENGHSVGDQVLIEFARRLRSKLRGGEYISRIGGDEFLVVIREALDESQKQSLTRRLRLATRAPMTVAGGKKVDIDISIGIAVWPIDGHTLEDLKTVADMRMYADKSQAPSGLSCLTPIDPADED